MTMTLYDFADSGNGYKVRLMLSHLGTAYNYIFYAGIGALVDLYPIDSRWQELQIKGK